MFELSISPYFPFRRIKILNTFLEMGGITLGIEVDWMKMDFYGTWGECREKSLSKQMVKIFIL
jgi:hypothetical protein